MADIPSESKGDYKKVEVKKEAKKLIPVKKYGACILNRQMVIILGELCATLILWLLFKFDLQYQLWDQNFLNLVLEDWTTSPIVDLVLKP